MSSRKIISTVLCLLLLLTSVPPIALAANDSNTITLENGTPYAVELLDQEREDGKLAIFSRNYGDSTKPFTEATAEVIVVGGIVAARTATGTYGSQIPSNGYVLSGTGITAAIVNDLQIGDSLTTSVTIPTLPSKYFIVNNQIVPITQINGVRIEAAIVLYLPSIGSSTKTNPWGMEITVDGGIVTKVVSIKQDANGNYLDNNSQIPANGYVLSVQAGSPFYAKLNGAVKVGDSVELNTSNETMYHAVKTSYNAFNPKIKEDNPAGWDDTTNAPYPGFRGADQLIVYDNSYGASTGTNPWGYEVVINQNGKVSHIGGNNSPIPSGGYVVSGHGIQAKWLTNNVSVGSTFKLLAGPGKNQVLFLFTPESYLDKIQLGIDAAETGLATSKQQFLDVSYSGIEQQINETKASLDLLKTQVAQGDYKDFFNRFNHLNEEIDKAVFMNYESRKVDDRSVWIRPKDTNLEQVKVRIAKLHALNINSIYLETWWNGYTAFPTENPLTAQNPIYGGFDVLQAYIDEAKKSGIEVHAWVENFFVGVSGQIGPVRSLKPEWSMISRKGQDFQPVPLYSTNYYWLNPLHPEVRNFISDLYKEMLQKYDLDGLQFDYMRYPDSGDYTNDYGYDPYSRNLFKEKYNADPIDLYPGDDLWDEWVDLRRNTINEFVYRLSTEARAIKPDIRISASVWPNYKQGPAKLLQEPRDWIAKNYIDQLFPMSYNPDASYVALDAKNSVELADNKALVVIGVGTNIGLTKKILLDQIKVSMDNGVSGSALFEYESLFENGYDKALAAGLYSKPAIVPDKDPILSLRTIISEMERKINEIYVPFNGMSESSKYVKELEKIQKGLEKFQRGIKPSNVEAEDIQKTLNKCMEMLETDISVHSEVKKRMKADAGFFQTILMEYLSKA